MSAREPLGTGMPHHQEVPRAALIGAAVLVLGALGLAAGVRLSGVNIHQAAAPVPRLVRELWFVDQANGAVQVLDAESGQQIATLEPGQDGFVRATLRTFVHERRMRHVGPREPFRLLADGAGRLLLEDRATQRSVELEAFGPTNAAAFARLLTAGHPAARAGAGTAPAETGHPGAHSL